MKIISKIFYGLFVSLLLAVAGLFLASLLPIPGNIAVKIVRSGSMEPAIKTGSIVLIRPSTSYEVGDIVTFGEDTRSQIPTTHRIVSKRVAGNETFYMTKGDGNEEADQTEIRGSLLIGKVLWTVPYAGYVLDFARQPVGFIVLIGIPAGIIILDESIHILSEITDIRRRKRRNQEA